MTEPSTPAGGDNTAYSFRPSLLGAPWQFKLTDDGIEWVTGQRSGRVPFRNVRRLRMSYRPVTMQSQRFVTEVWAEGAPKLKIVSSSWKSIVEQERLDKQYSAFVAELHRRLIRAAAPVYYEQGTPSLKYWLGFAVFAAIVLGLCLLIVRTLLAGSLSGAAFIAGFLALLLWQVGVTFLRNRPGRYRPEAPPAAVMPKG